MYASSEKRNIKRSPRQPPWKGGGVAGASLNIFLFPELVEQYY